MTQTASRKTPSWLWGAVLALFAVAVGALLIRNGQSEPSAALVYDASRFQQTSAEQVLFEEAAHLDLGISNARSLAVGPDDRIYVTGEKALAVYDPAGAELRQFPLDATPTACAAAPDGSLILAMGDRLEFFGADGALRSKTDSLGKDVYITSVAAGEKEIYAADAANRVVLRLDPAGAVLGRIGEEDAKRDIPGFVVPSPYFDVAFDPDGALWAVNPGRLGLEQYRPDGSLVTSWYRPSMEVDGFSGCCNPIHVAFRKDGALVTAEKGIPRVKLYSADWRFVGVVAGPEAFEVSGAYAAARNLDTVIVDLAVDSQGRVLVLDGGSNIVRAFKDKGGPTAS